MDNETPKRPDALTCAHDWLKSNEHSVGNFWRYQCQKCGCWGWRTFKPRMDPVKVYLIGKPKTPRLEPDPGWGRENHRGDGAAVRALDNDRREAARSMGSNAYDARLRRSERL